MQINKYVENNVSVGLKAGCLVSPLLFNMYINDLIAEIKDLNCGVKIDDELMKY